MPWIIGAAVLLIGLFWADRRLSAAQAAVVAPASPAGKVVAPPGSDFTLPITDANTVRYYQGVAATLLATMQPADYAYFPAPITPGMWVAGQVDGNAANPQWVKVLGVLQTGLNAEANAINPTTQAKRGWPPGMPAGFPAQLRTDGVLDYATAMTFNQD